MPGGRFGAVPFHAAIIRQHVSPTNYEISSSATRSRIRSPIHSLVQSKEVSAVPDCTCRTSARMKSCVPGVSRCGPRTSRTGAIPLHDDPGVMHLVRLVRFVQQDGPLAIDSKVDHGAPLRLLLLPGSSSIALRWLARVSACPDCVSRFKKNAVVLLTSTGIAGRPSSDLPRYWKHDFRHMKNLPAGCPAGRFAESGMIRGELGLTPSR